MKNYLLFVESSIKSRMDELEWVGPREYYEILEIAALDKGKVIAYSHYTNDLNNDYWFSDLLWVKKEYRNEKYPLLALTLILLNFVITGKNKFLFEDMSISGKNFLKKYDKEGYWKLKVRAKEVVLTKKGKLFAEEQYKKFFK